MKNVNCANCGHSISSQATSCPSCGHPHRPTRSRAPLAVLALVALGVVAWSIGSHQTAPAAPSVAAAAPAAPLAASAAPAPTTPPGYSLNDHEGVLLRYLLIDEFRNYAAGNKTLAGESNGMTDTIRVTADQYQRDYDRNEVAGDKAYLGKRLVVRGRVTSIDRSVGQNYFLQLAGGTNMFMAPHAMMADGYTDYLAGLSKGQAVNLACDGDGMLMKSASLTKCIPADDWANAEATVYIASAPARVAAGDKTAQLLMVSAVALASILPPTSPCYVSGAPLQQCAKDMTTLQTMKDPKPWFAAAKKLNIDLNAIMKPKAPTS